MEASPKGPGGRPTLYKPEYCKALVEHMSKGFSYETFGAVVNVSKQTMYDWEEKHPEYVDAKKEAFLKCQLFWENIGIEGIWNEPNGRTLNTGNYCFQMKNRFKWSDRVELSGDDMKPILLGYNPKDLLKE
jgi:DNA-binding XRE family transcriptional regulator